MRKETPLVAIQCLAYNHGQYIRETLEGFIQQKTTFKFIAIIHDDVSTDNTRDVIREYAAKYPDVIIPIFETENQFSKGDASVFRILNEASEGAKYIAMCEGDDYWTDSLKLQKQVDFLENHPDTVYTCHLYSVLNEDGSFSESFIPKILETNIGARFTLRDAFTNGWFTKTLTCVFRADAYRKAHLDDFKSPRDIHIVYELLSQGYGYLFGFNGGVYRRHAGGIFSSLTTLQQALTNLSLWEDIYQKRPTKLTRDVLVRCYQNVVYQLLRRGKLRYWPQSKVKLRAILTLPMRVMGKLISVY